jgi:hypothetical protein
MLRPSRRTAGAATPKKAVAVSLQVAADSRFNASPLQVRPIQRARVEQHVLYVAGEDVAIPDAEMVELVPAQEEALQAQWGEEMIEP